MRRGHAGRRTLLRVMCRASRRGGMDTFRHQARAGRRERGAESAHGEDRTARNTVASPPNIIATNTAPHHGPPGASQNRPDLRRDDGMDNENAGCPGGRWRRHALPRHPRHHRRDDGRTPTAKRRHPGPHASDRGQLLRRLGGKKRRASGLRPARRHNSSLRSRHRRR